jgi:hypothetical protein
MGESVNKVAFLWDESFLWGLMAYKALKANGLPFKLIRSEDIKKGLLKNYKMLFVPGGWASNKMKTLGEKGIGEIKNFVNSGGNYLGFCGGAGLATLNGIGLLDIKRMPSKQRVPSFSGRIHLNAIEHAIWNGISRETEIQRYGNTENSPLHRFSDSPIHPFTHSRIFHAWWPSQFLIVERGVKILATYADAMPDAFSSDVSIGDVEANSGWEQLEKKYGINLNPKRLLDEPAVVEGRYGKGKVILSLVHFDTPGDENGAEVLRNLWKYLNAGYKMHDTRYTIQDTGTNPPIPPLLKGGEGWITKNHASCIMHRASHTILAELDSGVDDLISFGIRNFLWFWRNPMLLQWRRGVRGLEYCTLHVMIKELSAISHQFSVTDKEKLQRIKKLLMPFSEKAKKLLIMERLAMQNSRITYDRCDDPEIRKLRKKLFGNSKSHGGLFKDLLKRIDDLLYLLLSDHERR